jgi:hypothetical protein
MGWYGLDQLALDRDQWRALVNTAMNHLVPQNAGKFLSSCTTSGFPRRAQLSEVSYMQNYARKGATLHLSNFRNRLQEIRTDELLGTVTY